MLNRCHCLLILCLAIPATAQSTPKLPDDFARSAFKVLKVIEGETGQLSQAADGSILVPRDTKTAINDLDADAATADEQLVVHELDAVFNRRLEHNTELAIAAMTASNYLMIHGQSRERADVAALVAKLPQVAAIHQKEAVCFQDMEATLRSRSVDPIAACSKESMTVPSVETSDVIKAAER